MHQHRSIDSQRQTTRFASCLQVLNLTCTECGKPCRTQTECDLHTKRTGHGEFVDKVRMRRCCLAFHSDIRYMYADGIPFLLRTTLF